MFFVVKANNNINIIHIFCVFKIVHIKSIDWVFNSFCLNSMLGLKKLYLILFCVPCNIKNRM